LLLRIVATTSPIPSLLLWAAFAAPPALLREYCRQFCFAHFLFAQSALLDLAVGSMQITTLLLLGRYHMLTAPTALFASGGACGSVALCWLWAQRRAFTLSYAQSVVHLGRNWHLGKWICASTMLMLLSNSLYPWLLTVFRDATATGIFAACWSLVSLANPLLFGLGNFLGSRTVYAASTGRQTLRAVVANATLVFASVALVLGLILTWIGDRLLERLYGNSYAGNDMPIRMLAGSILFWAIGFSVEHGLQALERPDLNLMVNSLAFGFTLTAGVFLVRSYGVLGAACSLVLLSGFAATLRHVAFNRASRSWRPHLAD
jgi:O-antigen/teichoic acid export membrane protein